MSNLEITEQQKNSTLEIPEEAQKISMNPTLNIINSKEGTEESPIVERFQSLINIFDSQPITVIENNQYSLEISVGRNGENVTLTDHKNNILIQNHKDGYTCSLYYDPTQQKFFKIIDGRSGPTETSTTELSEEAILKELDTLEKYLSHKSTTIDNKTTDQTNSTNKDEDAVIDTNQGEGNKETFDSDAESDIDGDNTEIDTTEVEDTNNNYEQTNSNEEGNNETVEDDTSTGADTTEDGIDELSENNTRIQDLRYEIGDGIEYNGVSIHQTENIININKTIYEGGQKLHTSYFFQRKDDHYIVDTIDPHGMRQSINLTNHPALIQQHLQLIEKRIYDLKYHIERNQQKALKHQEKKLQRASKQAGYFTNTSTNNTRERYV